MICLELKKLLRDSEWKYIILVVAGGLIYYSMTYNELPVSTGLGIFNVMNHQQLLASISAFPAFLFLYLLYRIAQHQENYASWKCELAYRKDQKAHICSVLVTLLLFQPIPLLIGCGLYYVFTQTFDIMLLRFLITLEFAYLISYFYYTFIVKSGIMTQGLNVSVVNPLRSLTPIFLGTCILNMGDWLDVLSVALMPMLVTCVILFSVLCYQCNYWMRVKLHRELVLNKLFAGVSNPRMEHVKRRQKKQLDTFMQAIFRIVPCHSAGYWRFVSVLEVSIKQKGYPLLLMIACLVEYLLDGKLFFLCLVPIFLIYFILFYHQQKQMIKKVRILPNNRKN